MYFDTITSISSSVAAYRVSCLVPAAGIYTPCISERVETYRPGPLRKLLNACHSLQEMWSQGCIETDAYIDVKRRHKQY